MKIEFYWIDRHTTQELYALESEFYENISSKWQGLIDKLIQMDFPETEEDVIKFNIFLNEMVSNKEIYNGEIHKDVIYIVPIPRYYDKYLKITK